MPSMRKINCPAVTFCLRARLSFEMTPEALLSTAWSLRNKLYRYARSITGDSELARDVVQETLIRVWEQGAKAAELRHPEAWCMTLTRNFALGKLRSQRVRRMENHPSEVLTAPENSPYEVSEQSDNMGFVRLIVNRLPLKQREVFRLRDVEGYSYREIAGIIGLSESDVRVSLHRARTRIREEMEKYHAYGLKKSTTAT